MAIFRKVTDRIFICSSGMHFRYFGFAPHEQIFDANDIQTGEIGISQFSLAELMPKHIETWNQLAKHKQLDSSAFNYATWNFIGQ